MEIRLHPRSILVTLNNARPSVWRELDATLVAYKYDKHAFGNSLASLDTDHYQLQIANDRDQECAYLWSRIEGVDAMPLWVIQGAWYPEEFAPLRGLAEMMEWVVTHHKANNEWFSLRGEEGRRRIEEWVEQRRKR